MGFFWRCVAAIASRLIFVCHSVWSLREILKRVYLDDPESVENSKYWILTLILALIVIEGGYSIVIRKGHEYKFFWPSGFVYIILMIPIICILESFLMDEEMICAEYNSITRTVIDKTHRCYIASLKNKDDQKLRAAVEIGMLGALVAGRWLLPRGELTRDQLSALLLAFIGNGADCIEFLNTWNDFPVLRNKSVTNTVLALYSLSMLQFSVVTTKTTEEYIEEEDFGMVGEKNNGETYSETSRNKVPAVPRYIQKLLKEKAKKEKLSYRATLSSVSLAFKTGSRSRAQTHESILKVPRIERKSSFEYRTRVFTMQSLEDNVFEENYNESLPKNRNRRESNYQTSKPENKKKKRIQFEENNNNVHEDSYGDDAAAKYLQSLANTGRWDEFSEVLSKARSRGFSRTSASSAEALGLDNLHWDDEANTGCCIFRRFPKLRLFFDQQVFQSVILLATLELPYFIARVVFTIKYNVSSTTMVFYTTKNVIMLIFLVYRLWVQIKDGAEEDVENEAGDRDMMTMK